MTTSDPIKKKKISSEHKPDPLNSNADIAHSHICCGGDVMHFTRTYRTTYALSESGHTHTDDADTCDEV